MEAAQKMDGTGTPRTPQFGRFRLLEPIGQGGMANVIVAVLAGPAGFNKLVVLKTICEHIRSDDSVYAQMFLDEARLAARLNHQNVVHTYEVGNEDGVYYIVMEYLEGQPLHKVLQAVGASDIPLEAKLRILIDTAQGLHHAHELTDYSGRPLHVVHRDVSPQNIFLTYDGQVKLLDFGIAKMRDAQTVTIVGQVKGKIDYMAPEQFQGEDIDRTADVFALGAIMWELLAGRPLSGGRAISQITRMHNRLAQKEQSLREVMPQLDPELSRICDKALMHEPKKRYPTALEFAQDLQQYLADRSLTPTSQQLAQILQPPFAQERADRHKRIEAALDAVYHEQTQLTDAAIQDSGARLTLSGQLSHHTRTKIIERTGRRDSASEISISDLIPVHDPPRSRIMPKLVIFLTVMCASAGLPMLSERDAEQQPVPRTESTTLTAAPSSDDTPDKAFATTPSETVSVPSPAAMTSMASEAPEAPALPAVDPPAAATVNSPADQVPPKKLPPKELPRPQRAEVAKPTPAVQMVKLSIHSTTPGIQILLDGSKIAALPFEAEVARDGTIHKLVASAPGYKSSSQVLTMDRNRRIAFELSAEAPPAPRPGPRVVEKDARVTKKVAASAPASRGTNSASASSENGVRRPSEDPVPGQEMARRAHGPEMSDEDPWQ